MRASLFLNLPRATYTPFAKLEEEGTFVRIIWVIWTLLVVVDLMTIYREGFWKSREMRGQMMLIWDLCKINELDGVSSWDEFYKYLELMIWDVPMIPFMTALLAVQLWSLKWSSRGVMILILLVHLAVARFGYNDVRERIGG